MANDKREQIINLIEKTNDFAGCTVGKTVRIKFDRVGIIEERLISANNNGEVVGFRLKDGTEIFIEKIENTELLD